jgi:uncharacterized protein YfdQ (DUF2303 family)
MPEMNETAVRDLLAAGKAIGALLIDRPSASELPGLLVPEGYKLESFEALLERPLRGKAHPEFTEANSFENYVVRHKTPETHLFARLTETAGKPFSNGCFMAVFDYPLEGKPTWMDHKATLVLLPTVEWVDWLGSNRSLFSPVEFAQWLEKNEHVVQDPPAAALMEMVETLSGKQHVDFTSAVRLQNGTTRLAYVEEISLKGQTSAAQGFVELPKEITVGLAPFEGGAAYKVRARLRYRIESQSVKLWYELVNPHLVLRDALKTVVKDLEEATGLVVLMGRI